jgi:hypothetical protein
MKRIKKAPTAQNITLIIRRLYQSASAVFKYSLNFSAFCFDPNCTMDVIFYPKHVNLNTARFF